MEAISTGNNNGIKLEEYNGVFSFVSQREGEDGKFYTQWAKFHKSKDEYMDKDWPIKCVLGDKATAEGVLLLALKEITGQDYNAGVRFNG